MVWVEEESREQKIENKKLPSVFGGSFCLSFSYNLANWDTYTMPRSLQVFLCHASQDKPEVWKLHRYLKTRGVKPWLDVEDLLPGEDWEVEIPKALFSSDIILVCLSKNSVNKEGYVQKEIAFALDKALEKPEGTIFIIPVKLEDCELPKRLSRYQAVDLFRTDGRKRLLMGLNKRIGNLGDEVLPLKIDDTKQRTPKIRPLPEGEGWGEGKPETKQEEKHVETQPILQVEKQTGENQISPELEKKLETKGNKQNFNFRTLGVGGLILFIFICVLFSANYLINNLPISEIPIASPSRTLRPATATFTNIPITPTIAFTPTPGIGSTLISEKDGMTLVFVPAGEFTMGSENGDSDERPVHQVFLDSYWIDQTEVTNAMYAKCVEDNQCTPPSNEGSYTRSSYYGNSQFDNYPVIYVSWNDAKTYCEWAGRRLPTEAEWENAARGTDGRIYPWGNTFDGTKLNFCDYKCALISSDWSFNDGYADTAPVGNYPQGSSIYGAFDMSGNVWEWVNDSYASDYYLNSPSFNPMGPTFERYKVARGGSWYEDDKDLVRSANRYPYYWLSTKINIGFRCAMNADQ